MSRRRRKPRGRRRVSKDDGQRADDASQRTSLLTFETDAPFPRNTEEVRRDSDALFKRDILAARLPQRTSRAASGVEASVEDSKVAIITFLTDAPVEGYNHLEDYETIFPLTSHSLESYANQHGYSFTLDRRPFEESKQVRKAG